MKAAEDHSCEMREKARAIEARRSTDTRRTQSDFPALMTTGMRPRNERAARIMLKIDD